MIDTLLEVIDMEVVDIEPFRHHRFYSSRNKFFWTRKESNLIQNHYHGRNSKGSLLGNLLSGTVKKLSNGLDNDTNSRLGNE